MLTSLACLKIHWKHDMNHRMPFCQPFAAQLQLHQVYPQNKPSSAQLDLQHLYPQKDPCTTLLQLQLHDGVNIEED